MPLPAQQTNEAPYLQYIDYPDPENSLPQIERIITAAEALKKRLPQKLLVELEKFVETFSPLGSLTYAKEAPEQDKLDIEGRGMYHTVPYLGREITIYVKGIGHEPLSNKAEAHPGFPIKGERVFRDGPYTLNERRIVGALSLGDAIEEFVNSAVLFVNMVDQLKLTSMEEVIDAKIPVPISVFLFPDLSQKLYLLAKSEDGMHAIKAYGSIVMLTPDNRRVMPSKYTTDPSRFHSDLARNLADVTIAKNTGKTLRFLLDQGFVYEISSAHAQNLYQNGTFTHADCSDLLFLRDLEKRDDCINAIFSPLDSYALGSLSPSDSPSTEYGVSYETVVMAQFEFLKQLLEGIADHETVYKLAQLMPVMKSDVMLAIASVLYNRMSLFQLDKNDTLRTDFYLSSLRDEDRVIREIADIKKNTFATNSIEFRNYLHERAPTIARLRSFIETGNSTKLEDDSIIQKRIQILKIIQKFPSEQKDRLFELCGLAISRMHYKKLAATNNFIYECEDDVLDFLLKTLNGGNANESHDVLRVIASLSSIYLGRDIGLVQGSDRKYYFHQLQNGIPAGEIANRINFCIAINNFLFYIRSQAYVVGMSQPGNLDPIEIFQGAREFQNCCADVEDQPEIREPLQSWISELNKLREESKPLDACLAKIDECPMHDQKPNLKRLFTFIYSSEKKTK
jgi:hypothetical protein